jgi:hypothetical protein
VITEFLDQRRREGRLEGLAVGEADGGAGSERVERLRGRDADLGPAEIADELEDALVQGLLRQDLVQRALHALEILLVLDEQG